MMRSLGVRWRLFVDAVRVEFAVARHRLQDQGLFRALLVFLLIMAAIFIVGFVVMHLFMDPDELLPLLEAARSAGPFIIIGFIILEVVFAPVPGTFITVAAGAVYGMWLGALYSYVGNVLGSCLAFFLARRFGRRLVERLVSKQLLERYDGFFRKHRELFLVFYALPVIPVDILSFSCGLSSMKWRKFLLIMMSGFVSNTLILTFLGERLAGLSLVLMVFYTLVFLAVFSLLAWAFRLLVARFRKKDI
ncbi:TVP38/TMEM64 family protein [Candidatus Woesearchaeota archaeon]|nr:TVP38/TMEM64 family protein [Candidatus Woesearchaeota archaeon]